MNILADTDIQCLSYLEWWFFTIYSREKIIYFDTDLFWEKNKEQICLQCLPVLYI